MQDPQTNSTDRANELEDPVVLKVVPKVILETALETASETALETASETALETASETALETALETASEEIVSDPEDSETDQKTRFEVVFFVRYNRGYERPSKEEIESYFLNYGEVHHINCPENRNYVFVFMTSLLTDVKFRRTRTIISQIIREMDPERRFYITVASSNRNKDENPHPMNTHQVPYERERQSYQKSGGQRMGFTEKRYTQNRYDTAFSENQRLPPQSGAYSRGMGPRSGSIGNPPREDAYRVLSAGPTQNEFHSRGMKSRSGLDGQYPRQMHRAPRQGTDQRAPVQNATQRAPRQNIGQRVPRYGTENKIPLSVIEPAQN